MPGWIPAGTDRDPMSEGDFCRNDGTSYQATLIVRHHLRRRTRTVPYPNSYRHGHGHDVPVSANSQRGRSHRQSRGEGQLGHSLAEVKWNRHQ